MLRPHIDNQQKPMWIFVLIMIYVFGAIYNGNVGISLSEYGRNIVLCYALPILAFWILFKILPPHFQISIVRECSGSALMSERIV